MSSWMGKRRILLLLLAVCTACAVYLFFPSDESRIQRLFREGAKAFESKDLDRVMSRVSFNYRDEYGMTYLSIREFIKRKFEAISDIEVEYDVPEIRVERERAEAVLSVRVTATSGNETGYIIGDIKNPLRLRFTLEKELTRWLIVKTDGLEGHRFY
jgi:transcriptional regulator of nitric oxide reductase